MKSAARPSNCMISRAERTTLWPKNKNLSTFFIFEPCKTRRSFGGPTRLGPRKHVLDVCQYPLRKGKFFGRGWKVSYLLRCTQQYGSYSPQSRRDMRCGISSKFFSQLLLLLLVLLLNCTSLECLYRDYAAVALHIAWEVSQGTVDWFKDSKV